jgi:hypothetical protein
VNNKTDFLASFKILELQKSILRKLPEVKRFENLQRWFARLRFKREACSFSVQHFRPFNRHPKAQPGILPSKKENGRQRFYAQFCRLTVTGFSTG